MIAKRILTVVLLLFVATALAVPVAKRFLQSPANEDSNELPRDGVVAYYFHAHTRCPTCRTIESYAQEAIETGFPSELAEKKLVWRVVNYEKSANTEYVHRYKIVAPIVVLARMHDGSETRSVRLGKVWYLTDDKAAFVAYVQQQARSVLDES